MFFNNNVLSEDVNIKYINHVVGVKYTAKDLSDISAFLENVDSMTLVLSEEDKVLKGFHDVVEAAYKQFDSIDNLDWSRTRSLIAVASGASGTGCVLITEKNGFYSYPDSEVVKIVEIINKCTSRLLTLCKEKPNLFDKMKINSIIKDIKGAKTAIEIIAKNYDKSCATSSKKLERCVKAFEKRLETQK